MLTTFPFDFTNPLLQDAVYLTGSDALLGPLLAIVYKDKPDSQSLSTILIGRHGISESINMTISPKSRFYGACLNLPSHQRSSLVRKAVAIACLRTFANMELALKSYLTFSSQENQLFDWDETTAGAIASRMVPATGKYPVDIGNAVIESGVLHPKFIKSSVIDIIYQDSNATNDLNNELVYLFGHQLEHLFDPLAEYSPEPTEMLYSPPSYPPMQRPSDNITVQNVCEELFSIQSHFTTDLLNLLQDYLIPLRVKVLGGDVPNLNMRKLNVIFPPTIDEIVRVNNIFYEALDLAMPYGSYEVIKACGISIPYFYKACLRHEATTRNFSANLRENFELIQTHAVKSGRFTINRIESIIHCSLHLTKIKMVLDRLVKIVQWREDEWTNVNEFYRSAVDTIDSFGRENFISPYDNRIFTPTGKLLVEISKGWPKELEYGWINRRVVTIFDAIDVIQGEPDIFNVVFIFTDSIVVIRPSEPLSITSDSGIHKPSVADMLMHSMINSVPLPNLPELNVAGWAPIDDVYMAEFGGPQNLAMYVTGAGFNIGRSTIHLKLFKLIRTQVSATNIINYISKAKIMNKTQPFHLFMNQQPEFSTFATVQEYKGYCNETRKCPVAVFANMNIPETVLDTHDLIACIGTQVYGRDHISISVTSKMAYTYQEVVSKQNFSAALSSQVSRLYSLYFASSNPFATEMIIQNNTILANYLIDFATARTPVRTKSHRSSRGPVKVTIEIPPKTPELKRQPSLLQRMSPSSVFSRISHKVSHDILGGGKSESKKRRSFSFLRSSTPIARGRENVDASKTFSTISLPVQKVTTRPSVATIRFSYPNNAPSSDLLVTPPPTKPKPSQTPTYLTPASLSPSQRELVVQRKASFSVAQSPITSRYVRNMPSQDMMSLASSQYSHVVKDSERFSDTYFDASPLVGRHRSTSGAEHYMETIESRSASMQSSRASSRVSLAESLHFEKHQPIGYLGPIGEASTIDEPTETPTSNSRSFITTSPSFVTESQSLTRTLSTTHDDAASSNSSVENWYQDLERRREESLDSFDTDSAPAIDNNETTFEDDDLDDLTASMKNITRFIDDNPKYESKPIPPLVSNSASDNSVLLTDDFAYLAGLVSGQEKIVSHSGSLYPDIRESSLVFLGNYIQSRDGSEMLLKQESIESLRRSHQQEHQQQLYIPTKPVTISEHEWLSTTEESLAVSSQQAVSEYFQGQGHHGSKMAREPSYSTDNMVVYSDSESNFSEGSDDVGSFLRVGQHQQQQTLRHAGPNRILPVSKLSLTEIQLRTLTVNLDSLIHDEGSSAVSPHQIGHQQWQQRKAWVNELERINFTVLKMYNGTHGLMPIPPNVQLEAKDQERVVKVEQGNRRMLVACLWSLIGAQQIAIERGDVSKGRQYQSVVTSFLDIEWERRNKMHEKLGDAIPLDLWSV